MQKKLYQRISDHMEKYGWFYGAVVQLLGTAALGLVGVGTAALGLVGG